jgi:Flp pilus assembly protein TadD
MSSHCHFDCAKLASALAALMLTSCAQWPPALQNTEQSAPGVCEAGSTPTDNTRLAAIEQMLNDGKFYAAIAQLDALGNVSPKAQLIRADALRRIDKEKDAQALYTNLVGSCINGRAHHGLGLLAGRRGDQNDSIDHLMQARKALPTDSRIRNDLGYALLLADRLDDAQFEFLTALDLNPQDSLAARNLVLLSFKRGDGTKARQVATKLGVDDSTFDRLAKQAKGPLAPTSSPSGSEVPLPPLPTAPTASGPGVKPS